MNTLKIRVPYEFAIETVDLSWTEILFAIDNDYLPLHAAIEHASRAIEVSENQVQEVLALACLTKLDQVYSVLVELSNAETTNNEQQIKDKLLYVILKWVYLNREKYDDPLEVVECVYADFDYPDKISSFVRYMPMSQPDLGTQELNIDRLYKNWKNFLDVQEILF